MLAAHGYVALRKPTSIEYRMSIPEPPEPQGTASPNTSERNPGLEILLQELILYFSPRLGLQAGLRASLCQFSGLKDGSGILRPIGIRSFWSAPLHPLVLPSFSTFWHLGTLAFWHPGILATGCPDILKSL